MSPATPVMTLVTVDSPADAASSATFVSSGKTMSMIAATTVTVSAPTAVLRWFQHSAPSRRIQPRCSPDTVVASCVPIAINGSPAR